MLFFLSVLAHELGHSLVSARLGMPAPSITLFIFGGIAQLSREPKRPRDEFLIAGAGPLVSLVLGLGFSALSWAGPGSVGVPLAALGKWLGLVNLGLGLFNLLPVFPLDGGRILRALVWARSHSFCTATIVAGGTGQVLAFGLIAWGIWMVSQGNWADGLWMAFIGMVHRASCRAECGPRRLARHACGSQGAGSDDDRLPASWPSNNPTETGGRCGST